MVCCNVLTYLLRKIIRKYAFVRTVEIKHLKVIWSEDGGWSTVVSGQRVEKREREGFLRSA